MTIMMFETWLIKGNFQAGDETLNTDAGAWSPIAPDLVGQPVQGIARRPKFCKVCGVRLGHEMHLDGDGKPYCRQHCPECSENVPVPSVQQVRELGPEEIVQKGDIVHYGDKSLIVSGFAGLQVKTIAGCEYPEFPIVVTRPLPHHPSAESERCARLAECDKKHGCADSCFLFQQPTVAQLRQAFVDGVKWVDDNDTDISVLQAEATRRFPDAPVENEKDDEEITGTVTLKDNAIASCPKCGASMDLYGGDMGNFLSCCNCSFLCRSNDIEVFHKPPIKAKRRGRGLKALLKAMEEKYGGGAKLSVHSDESGRIVDFVHADICLFRFRSLKKLRTHLLGDESEGE